MFGILLPVAVKTDNNLAGIMDDSTIICDEVIDADADAEAQLNDEATWNDQTKKFQQIFMKRK